MATGKEMEALSVEELNRRAAELRESLFNLKIQHRTGGLDSSAKIGVSRKDLARVLTALNAKKRAAKAAAPKANAK